MSPSGLSSPNEHESTVPIIDLLNELNTLLKDYTHVHGAPKQVHDTLTDIQYLSETLSYLETLFGDENHVLHLPEPAIEKFKAIKVPLKFDLRKLHHLLRKWPDPPTFTAMVTFGTLHNHEFRNLREKLIRHQLSFTVLLSEATLLPEDDFAGALAALLQDGETLVPEDRIPSIEAPITPNGNLSFAVESEFEIEQEEYLYKSPHPVWTELVNCLLTLPPTMRLSHLVEKLEHIQKITTSSAFPIFSAFGEDVRSLLKLARESDERLLKENHFSKDVRREMHTAIDLEVKFLLHELTLLGTLMKKGIHAHPSHSLPSSNYDTLPIHSFLQDHRAIFMMVLTLVAGARLTEKDPRHQEGTRRDEEFEAALAAVMGVLARHSARVNGWCEGRKCVEV